MMIYSRSGFVLILVIEVILLWQKAIGQYPLDYSRTDGDENGNYNRTIYLSYDQQQDFILAQLNTRKQGADKISITAAPYQVALFINNNFTCGGAIINSLWILTAGQCSQNRARQYLVRAGSRFLQQGGQTRRVVKIFVNRQFNYQTFHNDLALMKLNRPLRMGRKVQKVGLPLTNAVPRRMLVAGWQVAKINQQQVKPTLRAALVNYVSHRRCQAAYGFITRSMLCTTTPGKDQCLGDTGGPLVYKGVTYGIMSFGNVCHTPQLPGVYTRVSQFTSWIVRTVRRN